MAQNTVKAVPLTTILAAAVPVAYPAAPQATLPQSVFFLRIYNQTNHPITISFDGTTDHEHIAKDTAFELNAQTNSLPNNKVALFPKFQRIFIKGTGGGTGVYISGYYC